MAEILNFPSQCVGSFDPDAASILGRVFDDVMASLHGSQPEIVKEVIAAKIVELAMHGERDPDRLRLATVGSLSLARDSGHHRPAK